MFHAVAEAAEILSAHDTARSLLISGEGPAFCVGGDLKYFHREPRHARRRTRPMITLWHRTLPLLDELPIPVVSAIHGGTAGGGLGLVWCADHVVAAESTRIVPDAHLLSVALEHRKLARRAAEEGVSLNALVSETLASI